MSKYEVKDIMTVFGLKSEYCKGFNPRKSYRKTKKTERLITNPRSHAIIVGRAYRLVERMLDKDAEKKELKRAVLYLWVCIDAMKYQLDYHRAYVELGIEELTMKYKRN